MKTLTKLSLFLFIAILLFACNKTANANKEQTNKKETTTQMDPKETVYSVMNNSDWRRTGKTNILEDKVNVRIYPSLQAEVVFQLKKDDIVQIRGFSYERITIDGFEGNWANILYQDKKKNQWDVSAYNEGWVFSKYLNIGNIEPAPIRFVELSGSIVKISYEIAGEEYFAEVYVSEAGGSKDVHVTEQGNYYVIIWGPYEHSDYNYFTVPGTYILTEDTHELKHITYFGAFGAGLHAWTKFSNDFEYLIQDSGSGMGPRGITAWSLRDMKKVFKGSYDGGYYGGFGLDDRTIWVVYVYSRSDNDEEIMAYGKRYKEENPTLPPDIEKGLKRGFFLELLIECSINLETGEREIGFGRYILTE